MEILVTKNVTVACKTKRNSEVKVSGSNGMFSFAVGRNILRSSLDMYIYTDELDDIILALQAFKDTLNTKQEV